MPSFLRAAVLAPLFLIPSLQAAEPGDGKLPSLIISRCLADLDRDGQREVAVLFKGKPAGELTVLVMDLAFAAILHQERSRLDVHDMELSCGFGSLQWRQSERRQLAWHWDGVQYVVVR